MPKYLPFLLLVIHVVFAQRNQAKRVLLRDVETLTFYQDRMTNGRRSSPVRQISCVGGDGSCKQFQPSVVQCKNVGWDGQDVQWKCEAQMEDSYKFGETTVTCEGFDYPEDPYILAGSCGVEYTLYYTSQGKARQQESHYHRQTQQQQQQEPSYDYEYADIEKPRNQGSFIGNLIWYAMMGWLIYTLYVSFCGNRGGNGGYRPPPPSRGPGGGGGGGGGSDGFDPPPPYSGHDSRPSGDEKRSTQASSSSTASSTSTSSGPGFLSGAALGAAAGYFMGNRNARNTERDRAIYEQERLFGGAGRTGFGHRSTFAAPTRSQGFAPSAPSAPSSSAPSVGTSSGYGGTRRR